MSLLEELGIGPKSAQLDVFVRIGRSLGMQHGRMIVGTDCGSFSRTVLNAAASGMMSAGCDVVDAGTVPAPALAMCGYAGFISQIPETEDGCAIRLWNRDGTLFTKLQVSALGASLSEAPPKRGTGTADEKGDAARVHADAVKDMIGSLDCPVVLDCSNNCTSYVAPELLSGMGCDLISINSYHDPRRTKQRGIDEASVHDLMNVVRRNAGEIGIAINGIGTRISAVDENAGYVDGETLLALFAEYLKPKSIAVPVTASMAIDDIAGNVIRTPASDAAVSEALLKNKAEFGGCPSGSFMFPSISCSPDGISASALVAKIASDTRLTDMIGEIPEYFMKHETVRFEGHSADISKKIAESVGSSEYRKLTDTDGWRVEMDGGWYLIRFSGAGDNAIRITAEARDEVYMISLMDIAKDIVSNASK